MARETRRGLVTAALLLGTSLTALELNVVGTAMPTLVAQLGGLKLYGLVFSAYLLTATVTIPLYGRVADLRGRRPLYLAAILLFVAGSALCGAAPSMSALIGFRALQGLGAGGVIPITMTLFGDLYAAERRALVMGLFSTVWGVSSVLGPLVGGFLVSYVSWRWVFWINLPAGLLAGGLFLVAYHEPARDIGRRSLDISGALLLTSGLVGLLIGLQGVEGHRGWSFPLLGGAALLMGLFALHERRTAEPLIPLSVLRRRAVAVTVIAGLAVGGVLFGVVTFVPLFVQGVLHGSPTQAGLALVPLSVVWTAATFATGPLVRRIGYKPVVVMGAVSCAVGASGLLAVPAEASLQLVRTMAMVAVGAGMGLNLTASTIVVQDSVPWQQRGVATALMQFARTIGGMSTVTLLGALVTSRFADRMGGRLPEGTTPGELLDPKRWPGLTSETLGLARRALAGSIGLAFWSIAGLGLAVLLIYLAFPTIKVHRAHTRDGDPD